MIIWTYEECYCRYESGFTIKSIHSQRIDALRALLRAKRQCVEERLFRRDDDIEKKRRGDLWIYRQDFDMQMVRGWMIDGEALPNPLIIDCY